MNEFVIGGFALATAGHDAGKCYVIFQNDTEYVYLVDGRLRTIDRPKKKKKIHVTLLPMQNPSLTERIHNNSVKNEEIKRAIKMLQCEISNKEAM